jgi:aryl-alcohol dehydrogenase-like predicted oxidoreductase
MGMSEFYGPADRDTSLAVLRRAVELGVTFFDTSDAYGVGRNEQLLGEFFASAPGLREQVVLATKFGAVRDPETGRPVNVRGDAAWVREACDASLKRLGTDHIDLYQVHHFVRGIAPEEFWGIFERLVNDGKLLYVGTSNFPGWGLAKFQAQAWQRGFMGLISEQTQYNLLNRAPELEVLPAAKDFGIGILAYMPLAGGLLTGKTQSREGSRTQSVEREYGIQLSEENTQFSQFSQLCREIGEPEAAVAIAWTLAHPEVHAAIVGIRTVEHLEGLDHVSELELSPEVVRRLDEIFDINHGRPLHPGPAPEAYSW